MDVILGGLYIVYSFFCVLIGTAIWISPNLWVMDSDFWECTKSEVVVETLPRKEACIQYTRKDTK